MSRKSSRFDHVVVGRRRQHRLDIKLVCGTIVDVDARAYVLGIFRDVTPSGAARTVDQRLGGAITEFTTRRMFSGTIGEVFMMPSGRHAVPAETIVFAGLGLFDGFTSEVQQLVAENVIRTLIRTRVDEFATLFFGVRSGRSVAENLQSMLSGFLRGIRDADVAQKFRSITLCEIDPRRFAEIRSEIYRLLATPMFEDFEVTLDEQRIVSPTAPVSRAAGPRDPVYLLARQESPSTLRSSVLTAGDKATVLSGVQTVDYAALDRHLDKLRELSASSSGMKKFGESLARLVLPADVRTLIRTMKDRHLVVVHDAESSRIPWETLCIRNWTPAATGGLSRRYIAANLSIAKWLEHRRREKTLSVLLVVNTLGDLPSADLELERIQEIAARHPLVALQVLRGKSATKPEVLRQFRSGAFDAVHFAGHAFFDPLSPSSSGIVCAGREVLSGRELAGLGSLPSLVFFNACESGRIRQRKLSMRDHVEVSAGLAEAFLRGGVANYVGTYWSVGDSSAALFAEAFYREVLRGASIGDALLTGRRSLLRINSPDWADYLHYGDFRFVLKSHPA